MYARNVSLGLTLIIALTCCAVTHANIYEGSLSSADGGLLGTGIWVNNSGKPGWTPAVFAWEVTMNPDYTWHYEYTVSVTKGAVSHFIIATSDTFEESDIFNANGNFTKYILGVFSDEGGGNPNIPGHIRGIKFDDTWGLVMVISFDSTRVPVWGNFYAKDGNAGGSINTAWNSNFGAPVPVTPPSEGPQDGFVIVPDSVSVPEPAMFIFLALGGIACLRRRRA